MGCLRVFICCLLFTWTVDITYAKKKQLKITSEFVPDDCSVKAEPGDTLIVHYTGTLENGKEFDSSRGPGRDPFTIKLGARQVIRGWEEGLVGICENEVRKLVIPPHLGYGDAGVPNVIPGGSTLVFTVELLELQKAPLVKLPSSNFLFYLGIGAIIALLGYELYKRGSQKQQQIKESSSSKGKKNKKKR